MSDKDKYFNAFKQNQGKIDEITLGENFGFDENTTQKIISELLSEYKIIFENQVNCNYKMYKKH